MSLWDTSWPSPLSPHASGSGRRRGSQRPPFFGIRSTPKPSDVGTRTPRSGLQSFPDRRLINRAATPQKLASDATPRGFGSALVIDRQAGTWTLPFRQRRPPGSSTSSATGFRFGDGDGGRPLRRRNGQGSWAVRKLGKYTPLPHLSIPMPQEILWICNHPMTAAAGEIT